MKYKFFLTVLLLFFSQSFLTAKVWINELMQSNIDLVRDDLQDFPDSWIELYNDSEQSVNIQNWTISIEADYRLGWKINRSTVIQPKSYLLLYADKVASNTSTGLHTNFRLDSGSGGSVYLFDANGQEIDAVKNISKQPAPNIAFGRIVDGDVSWAYFVSATPHSSNNGKTSNTLLPAPVFSQKGGVFKNNISLKLSLPAGTPSGVVLSNIRYTLDNTEPTISSPAYAGELQITQTTVVRAKIIHPDYLCNRASVNTYIISAKELALPVICISTDPSYLWDDEFGIYCVGNGKYGLTGRGVDYPVNWNNNWRRPSNFEYFPKGSNSSVLNQLCEIRIAGGWTRAEPQKSLIVYANKRFGVNRFDYDLFVTRPNQEIKSFMIRNSGNDFWWTHFRDAAIQLFFGGKVDVDYQAYQPAIFYLNGQYWGIQNLRERSTEDNIFANYGIEDIDMIKNWYDLKAGDFISWDILMEELRKTPSQQNIQWIMSQVDINEFINYMILQMYVSNTDFPGNNIVIWRPRAAGGKWRFILKDTDFGLGIWDSNKPTHNAIKYITDNPNNERSRRLFNALLTQDVFRKEFYSRYAIYMGDLLHFKSTSHVIDSIQSLIEPAMQDHLNRWMPEKWWRDMNSWRSEISKMKTWCYQRNAEVYKHLQEYFKLGAIMKLTVEKAINLNGTPALFINGVRLRNPQFDGSYFQNETIELSYIENEPLYDWEITSKKTTGQSTVETFNKQNLSYKIASGCTSLNIRLVNNNPVKPTKDEQPWNNDFQPEISAFILNNQLQISGLQPPSDIYIYDISGKLLTKTNTINNSITIPVYQKGILIVNIRNKTQSITQKVINL